MSHAMPCMSSGYSPPLRASSQLDISKSIGHAAAHVTRASRWRPRLDAVRWDCGPRMPSQVQSWFRRRGSSVVGLRKKPSIPKRVAFDHKSDLSSSPTSRRTCMPSRGRFNDLTSPPHPASHHRPWNLRRCHASQRILHPSFSIIQPCRDASVALSVNLAMLPKPMHYGTRGIFVAAREVEVTRETGSLQHYQNHSDGLNFHLRQFHAVSPGPIPTVRG
ncbi:hypothetical protein GQ607_008198 [Colletotrichum asianum]|uniref:Uncharacterized protein n=1 Tax=Colletotrichum asianum TaxID=702518 RepID=A0A8H3WCT8_9PEZI|nr:hypothetical protein GQ607_008198 [Colletotrichum asianum]